VTLDGRALTATAGRRMTLVPPPERQIALLAQDPLLFPHLSVLDNVAFAPRFGQGRRTHQKNSRKQARDRAHEWLTTVGAAELADRRPHEISGGQAQRVALARALAADPQVLLLDEPMAALDVAVTPALRQTLSTVLRDKSVLLVTHDVLDALLLADRVLVIEGGKIVEEGTTAAVLSSPRSAFAARLAGLNLITGKLRNGVVEASSGLVIAGELSTELRRDLPPSGHAAVAVFRPSAVSVFLEAPGGSPRNAFRVTLTSIEPDGDRIRVRAGELSADITPKAAFDLRLAPGDEVTLTVKATEVAIYPT
jgi:molybdate transport system ATP-binding protein